MPQQGLKPGLSGYKVTALEPHSETLLNHQKDKPGVFSHLSHLEHVSILSAVPISVLCIFLGPDPPATPQPIFGGSCPSRQKHQAGGQKPAYPARLPHRGQQASGGSPVISLSTQPSF